MVLELKVPRGDTVQSLGPMLPVFLSYVLSFVYVGIYWNNHHHMLHACTAATGLMLWANLHLLFWLSLFPFATALRRPAYHSTTPSIELPVTMMVSNLDRGPPRCAADDPKTDPTRSKRQPRVMRAC